MTSRISPGSGRSAACDEPRPTGSFAAALASMEGRCNSTATRQAARYLSAYYDKTLAAAGLRATQFTILHRLAVDGQMPITALAESNAMDRTTLATSLKPLEREGLVTVRTAERDRRSRTVGITAAGLTKLEEAVPLWQAAQDRFEAAFGSDAAADLRNALRSVLDTGLAPWAD